MYSLGTCYLENVYNPKLLREGVTAAAPIVARAMSELNITHLAFRGTSGAGFAYPLSFATGIRLMCCRKEGEHSHAMRSLEGSGTVQRYAIIDDSIATGNTIRTIVEKVNKDAERAYATIMPKCSLILLYYRCSRFEGGEVRTDDGAVPVVSVDPLAPANEQLDEVVKKYRNGMLATTIARTLAREEMTY